MALLTHLLWSRPSACRLTWAAYSSPLVTVAIAGLLLTIAAPAQMREEYQVKAAFIYNFARFIEWPSDAFRDPKDPIMTCVLGHDPFGHWLPDTIEGHSVERHPLVIRRISKPSDATACQILFVAASEPRRTWSAIAESSRPGTLTIGESVEASDCAVINFVLEQDRVRFGINIQAAELEKLRISSRLLDLAKTVKK